MGLIATVRYGRLRHLADFAVPADLGLRARETCVVRSERGVEVGTVLTLGERDVATKGRVVLRAAAASDLDRATRLRERDEGGLRELVRARIETLGLAIRFVAAETLLDGERTILFYYAQDRVDLRELARELSEELTAKIELRQLGARERARACGGAGVCGLTLCCSTFLRELEPVTMRMAKVQGLSLAPDRTSGACGRLRCCLRYENPLYEEAHRRLPGLGALVETRRGSGKVVGLDPLAERVTLEGEDGRRLVVFAAEVVGHERPPAPAPPPRAEPSPSRWRGLTERLFGKRDEPPPSG